MSDMRTKEAAVEVFFTAAWASRIPLVMPNAPDDAIPEGIHAKYHNLPGAGQNIMIGSGPKTRYPGIVQVTINAPKGEGDKTGTTRAWEAGQILANQDVSGVKFGAPQVAKLGVLRDEEQFYKTVVRIPYYWDDLT